MLCALLDNWHERLSSPGQLGPNTSLHNRRNRQTRRQRSSPLFINKSLKTLIFVSSYTHFLCPSDKFTRFLTKTVIEFFMHEMVFFLKFVNGDEYNCSNLVPGKVSWEGIPLIVNGIVHLFCQKKLFSGPRKRGGGKRGGEGGRGRDGGERGGDGESSP